MLAPLNLGDYLICNMDWLDATYNVAVDHGWPPGDVTIHVEVLAEDRVGMPCCICRLGTRAEFVARSKYSWRNRDLYKALKDITRDHYITIATHEDGRSYCLPLLRPAPDYQPPADYKCIILSGYEADM